MASAATSSRKASISSKVLDRLSLGPARKERTARRESKSSRRTTLDSECLPSLSPSENSRLVSRKPSRTDSRIISKVGDVNVTLAAVCVKDGSDAVEVKVTAADSNEAFVKRKSTLTVSANLLSPRYEKEFTFTGYDIMADVGEEKNRTDRDGPGKSSEEVYTHSCRRFGIVPASHIMKTISTENIKCSSYELGGKGAKAVAISLVNNSSVLDLDIANNCIGNEGTSAIAELCTVNSVLTTLNLSWNHISFRGVQTLCEALKRNNQIKSLNLSGNHLHDDVATPIGDLLEQNIAIKELWLSHNDFRETAGIALGKAMGNNDTLEVLDLSWNHLRGQGAMAISKGLQNNNGLKHLDVSWNGFSRNGGLTLALALIHNTTLHFLDLTNNNLTPLSVINIITNIVTKNQSLDTIKLGMNPITPEYAIKLITIIREKMKSECALRELDLGKTVVDEAFLENMNKLDDLDISIRHGPVIRTSHDMVQLVETMYHDMDPVQAMFGYMKDNGLRVVDLMHRLDRDGNNEVDREEFVEGLKGMGFPLTRQQLDDLMMTMDKDGDGMVDLSRLGNDLSRVYKFTARIEISS